MIKVKKNNIKVIELKTKKNKNTIKRTVLIKDFIITEIIGIHDHEKISKQKNSAGLPALFHFKNFYTIKLILDQSLSRQL